MWVSGAERTRTSDARFRNFTCLYVRFHYGNKQDRCLEPALSIEGE